MSQWLAFLLDPLQYPFMVRGLLATLMVGTVCALVGVYVVLRGMAFFGDALAHAMLPGVAIGYLLGGGARGPLFWWGMVTAILTSLGIGALIRGAKIKSDTAIGIVFAGMFALGITMISTVQLYGGPDPFSLWRCVGRLSRRFAAHGALRGRDFAGHPGFLQRIFGAFL